MRNNRRFFGTTNLPKFLAIVLAGILLMSRGHKWACELTGLPFGNNLLELSSADGNVAEINNALAQGASVNSRNMNGMTPLMLAAQSGNADAVQAILQAHAEPNCTSRLGFTPLMEAIIHDSVASAQVLLEHGADPNHRSPFLGTALNLAVLQGDPDVVDLLLRHHADPNIADLSGRTLFALASDIEIEINPAIRAELIAAGAKQSKLPVIVPPRGTQLLEVSDPNASAPSCLLGQRELGSKMLRRDRQISRTHAKALAHHFGLTAETFLQ